MEIIEKELSYILTGIFFKTQDELGYFAREKQYGDLLEQKLIKAGIKLKREYTIETAERNSNIVDFFAEDTILIDIKAKPFIRKDDYYQMKRYLKVANKELGLIVNFRDRHLKPKRVLNEKKELFVDSDKKFVGSDRARGQVMLITVLALSGTLLGATAIAGLLMLYQIRQASDIVNSTKAIFAADAGIETQLFQIFKGEPPGECRDIPPADSPPEPLFNGATFRTTCKLDGSDLVIQSVGTSGNVSRAFEVVLGQ